MKGFRLTMAEAMRRGYIKPEAAAPEKKAWHQNFKRTPKEARTYQGEVFDSKSEMQRFQFLQTLERAGRIKNLTRQVAFPFIMPDGQPLKYPNGHVAKFTADFKYELVGFGEVIEEYKGFDNRDGKLRRALFEAMYKKKVYLNSRLKGIASEPQKTKRG